MQLIDNEIMQLIDNEIVDTGSLKGDHILYTQVTAIIQVNFTVNIRHDFFGKLFGDCDVQGDHYIQGRLIQV